MTLPYLPNAPTGFRLETGAGTVLAELPLTLRPTSTLGQPRALEWERAPYSEVWRPVGDDLPTEVPALTLSGTMFYPDADAALADMARIEAAVAQAGRLTWRHRLYCQLRTDRRGLYLPSYGERSTTVNHLLNLYPASEITPELLTANQGVDTTPTIPPVPAPTAGVTTILIGGVPVQIPIWRTTNG